MLIMILYTIIAVILMTAIDEAINWILRRRKYKRIPRYPLHNWKFD